jgi:hypothetical protein
MPKPILKPEVRILRAAEYEQLREGAGILENQTRSDALLLTGLRYVEAQRLQGNPYWVDGRFIYLPAFAQRKVKRTQKERWVRLSSKGASLLPYFFKTKSLPTWKGWTQDMQRWESWLVASYPERVLGCFSHRCTLR